MFTIVKLSVMHRFQVHAKKAMVTCRRPSLDESMKMCKKDNLMTIWWGIISIYVLSYENDDYIHNPGPNMQGQGWVKVTRNDEIFRFICFSGAKLLYVWILTYVGKIYNVQIHSTAVFLAQHTKFRFVQKGQRSRSHLVVKSQMLIWKCVNWPFSHRCSQWWDCRLHAYLWFILEVRKNSYSEILLDQNNCSIKEP